MDISERCPQKLQEAMSNEDDDTSATQSWGSEAVRCREIRRKVRVGTEQESPESTKGRWLV